MISYEYDHFHYVFALIRYSKKTASRFLIIHSSIGQIPKAIYGHLNEQLSP